MANKVLLKKSSVSAKVPLIADLDYGEVALNYNDAKLFFKKSDGSTVDHFPSATSTSTLSNKTLLNPIVTAAASTVALQVNRVSGQPSIKSGGTDGYLIMDNASVGGTGVLGLNWYSADDVILAQGGGDVGIGTTTPSAKLHVYGPNFPLARIERNTALTTGMRSTFSAIHSTSADMVDGLGVDISFGIKDSSGVDYEIANFGAIRDGADNSGALVFSTVENGLGQGSVKMILKANGSVGIGTSTPSGKLDVVGTVGTVRIETTGNKLSFTRNGANYISAAGGSSASISYDAPVHYFNSGDGVTTRMMLNDSGNLGLGVSPSAWGGVATSVLEFQGAGHLFGVAADNYISVGSNTYYNGTNWLGKTTGKRATMYHQDAGRHEWFSTTGNVTAGATAAFNEVMQLDVNACLSIGTGGTTVGANQDYIRIAGSTGNYTDYHAIGNQQTNELAIQANTYTHILRGYSYTPTNRKMNLNDAAVRITNDSIFLAYDLVGNVNIGYNTNQSGYKLAVNGAFAATTKSFVIDHPTKPGMRLRYGSLEGPENGVYVRGRLSNGNTIELPDYWTKLVDPDSITVELTPIGSHQKLYVKDIVDNTVMVGNENMLSKSVNCFYTVYAERVDVEKLEVEIDGN